MELQMQPLAREMGEIDAAIIDQLFKAIDHRAVEDLGLGQAPAGGLHSCLVAPRSIVLPL